MNALLEIKGWQRITEVPDSARHRGWVRVAISPPFDILFRPDEKIVSTNITTVELHYEGIINNLPFFKARE